MAGIEEAERGQAMGRRLILFAAIAALLPVLSPRPARAADSVVLQLKWVVQAQFAGYYAAAARGFYRQLGLDVTVKPGGPEIAPEAIITAGKADVIVDWMPSALAARERGLPLVNIAQVFKRSGLELTCLKASGIRRPQDFRGHTLGVWSAGNEYPFLNWMAKLHIPIDGGPKGIAVLHQGYDVTALVTGQAACISTMSYNEYGQALDSGLRPSQLLVFKYSDQGVALLEDGLYALEDRLRDPDFRDRMARFVAATRRGWAWAAKNPDIAADLVLHADATGSQTIRHQRFMMREVAKLLPSPREIGFLAPADYERTVALLLAGHGSPVIAKRPAGAWTHAVWNASLPYARKLRP